MAKPAARKSDPYSCPLPGHGTNPIATGSPDVFFDGLSAALQGDTCTCGSALSSGLSSTVFINGKNAATIDTGGTHGGVVVGGSGTVIIGDTHTPCEFVPPTPLWRSRLTDGRSVRSGADHGGEWEWQAARQPEAGRAVPGS